MALIAAPFVASGAGVEAAKPGQLSYASAGPGTAQHLSMELFELMTKIDLVHFPYEGSGPAMSDLLDGQVKLMMDSTAWAPNAILDGRLEALAVTTARPAPRLEKVPSIGATVPGYDSAGWSGPVAPAKTPDEIATKVNADLVALMRDPAVLKQFDDRATLADPDTPANFGAFIAKDMATWAGVIQATGLEPGN